MRGAVMQVEPQNGETTAYTECRYNQSHIFHVIKCFYGFQTESEMTRDYQTENYVWRDALISSSRSKAIDIQHGLIAVTGLLSESSFRKG